MSQPHEWSFAADSTTAPATRRAPRRAAVITGAVVAVALITALVTWLAWPNSTSMGPAASPHREPKPLLNRKPPTLIEDGIEPRTLYPPGYVDFDETKSGPDRNGPYDPDLHYEFTSTPPGCEKDPLFEAQADAGIGGKEDPDKYRFFPIGLLMYPVDDPGGSKERTNGFSLTVWPEKTTDNLNAYRDWYRRCLNAKVTSTTTKNGQIVKQETRTQDETTVPAPSSEATDSLALAKPDEDVCELYGLVRGMMVHVRCPPSQRSAGVYLWRTVIHRVQNI